jgi:fatty acid desaturase
MSADVTGRGRAEASHGGPRRSRVHALLATVEHIVDNRDRTENARRLLRPVLVAAVLVVVALVTVVGLAAPGWMLGAIGAAVTGAGLSGYRRPRGR